MKTNKIIKAVACVTFLILVLNLPALVVNHIPPASLEPNQETEIKVEILEGLSDVEAAEAMYRISGTAVYNSVKLEPENLNSPMMRAYLPVPSGTDEAYEYYFRFTLKSGEVQTYPLLEAEIHPFVVQTEVKAGNLSRDFILLSDETSISAKDGYTLAVSWFALEGLLDKESIKIFVNGKDVTKRAYIGENMLLYREGSPKPGTYKAYITVKTIQGAEIYSNTWTVEVKPSANITNLPLNLRGNWNAGTNITATANDKEASTFGSDTDDGWTSLNLSADYEKLKLQAQTYISTLQQEDKQNVNRFLLGASFPFWDTYAGDYTPYLSNLTMHDKNIRGIYTKLHTGNFALTFTQGEIVRQTDGEKYVNPVTKETAYTGGTFKQEAIGTRLQLGKEEGFSLGFTTTRNRDIISSLDKKYIMTPDSVQLVNPQDNLVFSIDTRINIPEVKCVLGIEGAGSLYNRNTLPGPFTNAELNDYLSKDDSLSINPADFADIFIINTNMEPFPISLKLSGFESMFAWKAFLRSMSGNNLLNAGYSQTGASFHALSTNYMQNDASQLIISDQYTFKHYLALSGGFTQQKDNLSATNLETNTNNSLFLQSMLRIPRYPYLSFAYTENWAKNKMNDKIELTDSTLYIPYKSDNNLFSAGIGYEIYQISYAPTTIELNWRIGNSCRKTEMEAKSLKKLYSYDTNNISLSLSSRFQSIPLKTEFNFINNVLDGSEADSSLTRNNFGLFMRGEYGFWENRLNPWLEYHLTSLSGDQDKQAYNYLTLGANANPLPSTYISTGLGWQIYKNHDTQHKNYTTTVWRLTLTQRF